MENHRFVPSDRRDPRSPCRVCGTSMSNHKGGVDAPQPPAEKSRLWEIESHISIGNRFGAYLRLLQHLATEVERLMPLFEEMVAESVAEGAKRADPDGKLLRRQHVVDELRKHLSRIEAAAELDGPKEKKS